MGFLRSRSKSRSKTGTEHPDVQHRNRLSKPLTNKSQTNLRAAAKQESDDQDTNLRDTQSCLESRSASPAKTDSSAQLGAFVFSFDDDTTVVVPSTATKVVPAKLGVAQLVAQFEVGTSTPPTSKSFTISNFKSSTPVSEALVTRRPSDGYLAHRGYIIGGVDCIVPANNNYNNYRTSPDEASDIDFDPLAIPTRRQSTYRPGEATRKPVPPPVVPTLVVAQELRETDSENDAMSLREGREYASSDDGASTIRPETPTNLDRTSIGNLSLGSLHVVNGRVSPALSELSKHLQIRRALAPSRDVSSVYAESEKWEDDAVADDGGEAAYETRIYPADRGYRDFSYIAGAHDQIFSVHQAVTSEPLPHDEDIPQTPVLTSVDNTSALAEQYMAELPVSPFAELESDTSSSPTGSIRSTGSVVRYSMSADHDDDLVRDSPSDDMSPRHNRRSSTESEKSSIISKLSDAESKLSSVASVFAKDDAFQSALEFHVPHEHPQESRPPYLQNPSETVDSGYSSNGSCRSVSVEKVHSQMIQSEVAPEQVMVSTKKHNTPRKLGGFLPLKPALKTYTTATELPVVVKIESISTPEKARENPLEQSTPSPTKTKSPKSRKKLQKNKPLSYIIAPKPVKDIVVQRLPSDEVLDIPPVSPLAEANLGLRTRAIPELDRTFDSRSNKASPSIPGSPLITDIRFPSPAPELEPDERVSRNSKPKSRNRSKSRRRSILSIFKSDKASEKRSSASYEANNAYVIDDLGDVVSSLGANPYDVAHSVSRSNSNSHSARTSFSAQRSEVTPHSVSSQRSRPRSMMDARTASEMARSRSRSIHERDSWTERRSSFNDRGGIPGGNLHVGEIVTETPPVPPMPHEVEMRRISWRHSQQSAQYPRDVTSRDEPARISEPSPEPEDETPPLPPPHSPRPSFINNDDDGYFEAEENIEDLELAPPPPSHSPRPMDVTSDQEYDQDQDQDQASIYEDAWATQAREWKARRQSAGEALRVKWAAEIQTYHEPYYHPDGDLTSEDEDHRFQTTRNNEHHQDHLGNRSGQPPNRQTWVDDQQDSSIVDRANDVWIQRQNDRSYDYQTCYNYSHDPSQFYQADQPHDHNSEIYDHDHNQNQPMQNPNSKFPTRRPLPTPSQHPQSHRSTTSPSLAHDLHPQDRPRQAPPPSWSRYSGGLRYGYEGRDLGLTGSSGTRNISGQPANGTWKGAALKGGWGVDLGDVPIMGTAYKV